MSELTMIDLDQCTRTFLGRNTHHHCAVAAREMGLQIGDWIWGRRELDGRWDERVLRLAWMGNHIAVWQEWCRFKAHPRWRLEGYESASINLFSRDWYKLELKPTDPAEIRLVIQKLRYAGKWVELWLTEPAPAAHWSEQPISDDYTHCLKSGDFEKLIEDAELHNHVANHGCRGLEMICKGGDQWAPLEIADPLAKAVVRCCWCHDGKAVGLTKRGNPVCLPCAIKDNVAFARFEHLEIGRYQARKEQSHADEA